MSNMDKLQESANLLFKNIKHDINSYFISSYIRQSHFDQSYSFYGALKDIKKTLEFKMNDPKSKADKDKCRKYVKDCDDLIKTYQNIKGEISNNNLIKSDSQINPLDTNHIKLKFVVEAIDGISQNESVRNALYRDLFDKVLKGNLTYKEKRTMFIEDTFDEGTGRMRIIDGAVISVSDDKVCTTDDFISLCNKVLGLEENTDIYKATFPHYKVEKEISEPKTLTKNQLLCFLDRDENKYALFEELHSLQQKAQNLFKVAYADKIKEYKQHDAHAYIHSHPYETQLKKEMGLTTSLRTYHPNIMISYLDYCNKKYFSDNSKLEKAGEGLKDSYKGLYDQYSEMFKSLATRELIQPPLYSEIDRSTREHAVLGIRTPQTSGQRRITSTPGLDNY